MTPERSIESGAPGDQGGTIKQCCAQLYESDLVSRLIGDSFHPGGLELTGRLGEILQLTPESHVLDAASGVGTSALFLAERFGCRVVGVDFSHRNVECANAEAARRRLADRVRFERADAEGLPFADGSFDAVMCECAFCTFPDKAAAARQFARVLRNGGRLGLSDITRAGGSDGDLNDLMAWIACLADARPADVYAALFVEAGFTVTHVETHDKALVELVQKIRTRLFAAEMLAGLNQIGLPRVDFATARRMVRSALATIEQGRLGYAIVTAIRLVPLESP